MNKKIMLVDVSNYLYSSYFAAKSDKDIRTKEEFNLFWKYILTNMILTVNKKYNPDETILCIDSPNTWRKDYFKYYKCRRTLKKEDSDIDWKEFYDLSNQFLEEIKDNLPLKFIKVTSTEADDIIAILVSKLRDNSFIIVSRDKDFSQLLKYPNVVIHNPIDNQLIKCDNPHEFLTLHLLKGDSGDDVPNLLSHDKIFVTDNERQKKITQKIIDLVLTEGLDKYVIDNNLIDNYERNKKLIELSEETIPEELQVNIMYEYNKAKVIGDYETMIGFLKRNKMESILSNL